MLAIWKQRSQPERIGSFAAKARSSVRSVAGRFGRASSARNSDALRKWLLSGSVFAAALVALEFALPALGVKSYILPVPSAVIAYLRTELTGASLWVHTWATTKAILGGLAVGAFAGFALGLTLTQSKLLETILTPYILALQAVPKIALAPVIVLTLGYGIASKVAIAAVVAFFPMLINVMVGIRSVDRNTLDLMRQLRATRWQTLKWVSLPAAMPSTMAGLRLAASFAVLGAIVGEFTGASKGLGRLIIEHNFNFNQAGVFGALIMVSAVAIVLDVIIRWVSRRAVYWEPTPSRETAP